MLIEETTGPKLGHLRHAWNGAVTLFDDISKGEQLERKFAAPINGVATLEKETFVSGANVSASYPTDGSMMFDGAMISKSDTRRLLRRSFDPNKRSPSALSSAVLIWNTAVQAKAEKLATTSDPFVVESIGPDRPVIKLGTVQGHTVTVDASRYSLADSIGQVEYWYRQTDNGSARALIGRQFGGNVSVILMPLAKVYQ